MEHIKTTKTIRFKLLSDDCNVKLLKTIENLNTTEFSLSEFVLNLENFIEKLNDFLYYYSSKDDDFHINENFILKAEWVKTYAKSEYIERKRKDGNSRRVQHTISEYKVDLLINDTIEDVDSLCLKLSEDASAELNERAKRARTGLLLKNLYSKNMLPCLVDLTENLTAKKEKGDNSIVLKSFARKLLAQLEAGLQSYLPEQSKGIVVAKSTLNFYTLNKKPVDYEQKIRDLQKDLHTNPKSLLKDPRTKEDLRTKKEGVEDLMQRSKGKTLLLGDTPFMENSTYASLRQLLKNILAEQKAAFSEMVQRKATYDELRQSNCYLFNRISKDEYEVYKELSEKIEDISTKKNQSHDKCKKESLQSKLSELRKQRGKLISEADKRNRHQFKDYKEFSAYYRSVALKHGKILAQLIAIEKEKVESQMLQYWAVIADHDNRHQLILIPKEHAKECHEYLEKNQTSGDSTRLYWFESLTYRSLQKLCFGHLESDSNSFNQALKKELRQHFGILNSGEHELKGDEGKKIRFYQDVLSSDYAQKVLNLPLEEVKMQVINKEFKSLDDFKIALEKACYRRFLCTDPSVVRTLKEKYKAQILEITSLDLVHSEQQESDGQKFTHKDKKHTVIWKKFWAQENADLHFDIRLNPELSITYRKAKESRTSKYGPSSQLYDPLKNNRYLHDQFTLVTTVSEHCLSPNINQAFANVEEVETNIKEFNKKICRQKAKFAFGIDNGEVELSTLGVYLPQFNLDDLNEKAKRLKQVEYFGFEVITITNLHHSEPDKNGKERRLLQNPSYFLNKNLYCHTFGKSEADYLQMFAKVFKKSHTLSLDLSTAKVIDGHIVTNGDVTSLFNLWMRHAQRSVYDMNEHAKRKGSKRITLKKSEELSRDERRKFIDYLAERSKDYASLPENEKNAYTDWIYGKWAEEDVAQNSLFTEIPDQHRIKGNYLYNVLMAVSFNGEELVSVSDIFNIRNVFKLRKDFYCVKTEDEILSDINAYNVRTLSNEELDLKFNQLKSSLVANVIGVIDLLYKQYKSRFGGEGIIVMENFNNKSVENAREKFAGNIYRILERKIYLKFENYGLVPPVKNLLQMRDEKKLQQIGNVLFVSEEGTSQDCPLCKSGRLGHTKSCSNNCGFSSDGILHSNDGIAGFNIAQKGFFMYQETK